MGRTSRRLSLAAAVAALAAAGGAQAGARDAPPMGQFNSAYYTCDGGAAFQVSYDESAKTANMTTSNHKTFVLKRGPVSKGWLYSGEAVKFWTDGSAVTVDGTPVPYRACKMQ